MLFNAAEVNNIGMRERCRMKKLVLGQIPSKHDWGPEGPQICAVAGAMRTSHSEDRGFGSCKIHGGLGGCGRTWGVRERFQRVCSGFCALQWVFLIVRNDFF